MVKIEVYRYMWLIEGEESMKVRVVAGVEHEHADFIKQLQSAENVTNACRVYLHEIDVEKVEDYESIKNNKEDLKNEKSE